jgi:hypothetical protein
MSDGFAVVQMYPGLSAVQRPVQGVAGRPAAEESAAAHRDPPSRARGEIDCKSPPIVPAVREAGTACPSAARPPRSGRNSVGRSVRGSGSWP